MLFVAANGVPNVFAATKSERPQAKARTIDITTAASWSDVQKGKSVEATIRLPFEATAYGIIVQGTGLYQDAGDGQDAVQFFVRENGVWERIDHDEFASTTNIGSEFTTADPFSSLTLKLTPGDLSHFTINKVKLSIVDTRNVQQPQVQVSTQQFSSSQPRIVSRSEWGANPEYLDWDPEYAPVKKIVFHHTAGAKGGSNPASVIQGIYYYHAVSRGWGDIGYNFVIDEKGTVYEGRYGGLGVIGAHAQGFNTGSAGISLMGNYMTESPSAAMVESMKQMAAWLGARNGIDPNGTSWFGPEDEYANYKNILGHRDVGDTSCPGDYVYTKLSEVRQGAGTRLSRYRTMRMTPNGDQYDRAVAVSRERYPAPQTANAVVLISSSALMMGVTGSPLASILNAPILLTETDVLTEKTSAELHRLLKADGNVYLVGGTSQISSDVAGDIADDGYDVVRIDGTDDFDTATDVADTLPPSQRAILVHYSALPDAVSSVALSTQRQYPVLFTYKDSLPDITKNYLTEHSIDDVIIIGGTGSVGDAVSTTLHGLGISTTRVGGDDRYETARKVAEKYFPSASLIGLAAGAATSDILTAGSEAGKLGMALLQSNVSTLSSDVKTFMRGHQQTVISGKVFGGPAQIATSTAQAFDGEFPDNY